MRKQPVCDALAAASGVLLITLLTTASAGAFEPAYASWDQFLKKYVKAGSVNYRGLKKSAADFDAVVQELEGVSLKAYAAWTAPQKMAFWINAYNVGAVKLILDNYPLKKSFGLSAFRYPADSIQQIPDVWNRPVLNLLGRKVSLNHIENARLRREFEDPRVHFAIVCASVGCPVLREDAYRPEHLDAQLNDQIFRFVQAPDKFRYDAAHDTLFLSPIFKWFGEDFEKTGGIIPFVKSYASKEIGSQLSPDTRIEWQDYDWGLNEQQ
jgi:hypothetical protein